MTTTTETTLADVQADLVGTREERDQAIGTGLALAGQLFAALALLRRLEWLEETPGPYCPLCDRYKPHHAPDCDLAALLAQYPPEAGA